MGKTYRKTFEDNRSASLHLGLIIIVSIFAFFINNQVVPADLMEARNLATAQEMVCTGNYLVPTMNGELRLEKPPLPTWIAAGIEVILPGNLVAQRYATGIAGLFLILFLYLLVTQLTRNRTIAIFSALIAATCYNVAFMGRTATWDIYCHMFMLGAIYFLVLALERSGPQWRFFLLSGLFLGLSFLSKGPVSHYALFLPFLIAYIAVFRPGIHGKKTPLVAMILLFVVVSFWWSTYIYFFHPETATYVAVKETTSWLNRNVKPWYYYIQFPAEAGIWTVFFVTALLAYFLNRREEYRKEHSFSILWLLASLVLLSLIPEKKTRYLFPILIPGAIIMGFYFFYCWKGIRSKAEKWTFGINTGLIALVLFAIPIGLYLYFYREGQISVIILGLTALFCWLLCGGLVYALSAKSGIRVMTVFACVVMAMMVVETFCLIPIGKIFINDERHNIRELRTYKAVQGLPFYYNKEEELRMELVYESNQIIRPLDVTNDSLILKNRPFVFVSKLPIDSLFANKGVQIEPIDRFDNNWQKVESKRYNWELVREVAIIK